MTGQLTFAPVSGDGTIYSSAPLDILSTGSVNLKVGSAITNALGITVSTSGNVSIDGTLSVAGIPLNTIIGNATSNLATQNSVTSNTNAIAALNASNTTNTTAISTLSSTVGGQTTSIASLSSTVAGHTTSIAANSAAITANATAISTNSSALGVLSGTGSGSVSASIQSALTNSAQTVSVGSINAATSGQINSSNIITASSLATYGYDTVTARTSALAGYATLASANTFTGLQTINSSGAGSYTLTLNGNFTTANHVYGVLNVNNNGTPSTSWAGILLGNTGQNGVIAYNSGGTRTMAFNTNWNAGAVPTSWPLLINSNNLVTTTSNTLDCYNSVAGAANFLSVYIGGTAISSIYAPLASPTFTGTLTAPTVSAGNATLSSSLYVGATSVNGQYLTISSNQTTPFGSSIQSTQQGVANNTLTLNPSGGPVAICPAGATTTLGGPLTCGAITSTGNAQQCQHQAQERWLVELWRQIQILVETSRSGKSSMVQLTVRQGGSRVRSRIWAYLRDVH